MRGMAGFQSKPSGTYFVARSQVEPLKELLRLVFPNLDYWLQQPTTDVAMKGFLKLLAYLRMVFLQDFVLLRVDFPHRCLWNLEVFKHLLHASFVTDILARLNDDGKDMNSHIRLAIPILGQQVLNVNSSMTDLATNGFQKQLENALKMEGKLSDFLQGKIAFQLTPVKAQKLCEASTKPISVDPRLWSSTTDLMVSAPAFTPLSLVSPSKIADSSRSQAHQLTPPVPPPSYTLSRNIHTLTDLWKEWYTGLGTTRLLASLNDQYRAAWRKD